jgi:hypothetical protein
MPIDPTNCPAPTQSSVVPNNTSPCCAATNAALGDILTAVENIEVTLAPVPLVPVVTSACGGADVNLSALPEVRRVIQEPGTVFQVEICSAAASRVVETACNAAGETVVLTYDTQTVPPTELSRWNLTTNAAEPAGPLGRCDVDDDQIETVELKACLNGVSIPGFAIVTDAATQTVTGEQWRDPATGAWGALPAGAVIGDCPAVPVPDRKVLVWHESVTAVRSVADIVAAAGTQYVQSITVMNVGQAPAVITDDFGNNTRLYPGQSWSWSAITGNDARDYLGASALSIDASGTDVHLTATIVP